MRIAVTGLAAAAALTAASPVLAQPATPVAARPSAAKAKPAKAADPKAPATVDAITVTGASQNGFRSSIDRRSYGVANDLQATTGSIGDALRSVPSVEVDVQGNVSLRGDANVTIMIDGKPSGMFRGPGAAQALQNLPADQIERVEVITNPSAAFSPDGAAGIINLVTKQTRKAGKSGSVRVNVGDSGHKNVGLSGAYNSRQLTVSGDVALRYDPQGQSSVDLRQTVDPVTGARISSRQDYGAHGDVHFGLARLGVDYDPDKQTRISGEARYNDIKVVQDDGNHYVGPIPSDRSGRFHLDRSNGETQGTWRRKFAGDDHELVLNASYERTTEDRDRPFILVTHLPGVADLYEDLTAHISLGQTELKADYTRPMPEEAKLKAGYSLRVDDNHYGNYALTGASAATAAPDLTQINRFRYEQTINAAYGSYERPFGDFTVLAGLRLEEVGIRTNQITTHLTDGHDYFRAYPTLHLAYRLSDDQQLTASYSERVQRPQPEDLNPFRIYRDPSSYRAGNPRLQPQVTHAFEAGYQYKSGSTFYLATLYYRQNEKGVTDVIQNLGADVLLTTKQNLASSRNGGLELVANGRLTKTLSYNASTNFYWNQIDATTLDFPDRRQAFTLGGRANLNWQATSADFLQVNGTLNAKRLTPQGYRAPSTIMNLGYRHKFSDQLSAVVTVQDALATLKDKLVVNTPALKETTIGHYGVRAVFVGLSYSFGAGPRRGRDQGFDFGGGGPPS